MHNGIKKLFLTSLFVILGLCFNSSFAYTQIENCYDTNKLCRDYSVNESYNTNGATISYGAYLNTPGYSKSFMVQYDYTNSSSVTFKIRQYLIYNENGYYSIIQAFQRETEPQKTSIYLYTGSSGYCIPEEDNNRCGNATNSFKPYNKSIDLVNSGINGSIMTGYRIMFYDSTPNLVHVICPMFENGFMFCMPFRQQTNNGSISNSQNYGLTRQVIQEDTIPPFNDRDYITSNYTIGNTPFTITEPQTTPQNNYYTCPTIQQLINTYPSQYNTGLCYSSNLIFSNGSITTTTPKSIFELYPYLTGFMRDIDLYNNYCTAPNTATTCQTAFEGKEDEYTLISKAMDTNINKMKLYQYCNLQLNFEDKNATTCVSTGIYATGVQENITTQDIANALLNEDYQTILPTTTGTVFEDLEGEGRQVNWNILESIENIYTKITSIFQGRSGTDGIIPEYITRMILVICLFALFKK